MAIQTWETLKFIGPGFSTVENWFRDQFTPVPSKNEWGVDTLLREMRGPASLFESFIAGLDQGDTYTFDGATFYLQSWQEMADPVFPGARLIYKGFRDGLPDPVAYDSDSIQTESNLEGTYTAEYLAPTTVWKWIAADRENTHTAINDNAGRDPRLWKTVDSGGSIADLDVFTKILDIQTAPIHGTPYFEGSTTIQKIYVATA